jgi:hypothetical protein
MNRSVVTHHSTAWCRRHRATSRCTAGSVLRRRSGRRGKRNTGTPPAPYGASLPQLQPDQKAVGQHHRNSMPMEAGPQAPLILVPAHFPVGFFMELLHGIPPMDIAGQLFERGRRGQVAPGVFLLLLLASRGPFPQQPADMPPPVAGHPPTPHCHKLLAQPALAALPPANGAPLPTGQCLEHLVSRLHQAGRFPLETDSLVGAHPHGVAFLPCLQTRQ